MHAGHFLEFVVSAHPDVPLAILLDCIFALLSKHSIGCCLLKVLAYLHFVRARKMFLNTLFLFCNVRQVDR